MSRIPRNLIAWLLLAMFATVASVGEGLHLLPGCGHATWDLGRLFVLGGEFNCCGEYAPCEGESQWHDPVTNDIPILSEDECVICSVLAQCQSLSSAAQLVCAVPFEDRVPVLAPCDISVAPAELYEARAPPRV